MSDSLREQERKLDELLDQTQRVGAEVLDLFVKRGLNRFQVKSLLNALMGTMAKIEGKTSRELFEEITNTKTLVANLRSSN